ncbi:hypothetical protein BGZ49_001874 [Haplosporangium sp. Z 27]|nr:hypothetical protein BGZ49_001874 [Haplosporangium sp. Z 27]
MTQIIYFFILLLFLSLTITPTLTVAQNSSLYKPISYAASAILSDGGFYLYGGVIQFEPGSLPNVGTSQFLRLDLTQTFNTTSPPWTSLPGYLAFTMISAAPSADGKQFVIGGNRDHNGPLSYIYDVLSASWITAPDLPGLKNNMADYKRGNVGMSLDRATGLIYIYGGFEYFAFSQELSILDTTNSDPSKMTWSLSINQTTIPPLYQPIVTYLPTIQKTIVMGGCNSYNSVTGFIGNCATLNIAYLISGGSSTSNLLLQSQILSTGPGSRYQACVVVLANGNVLVQGGKDPTNIYGDAWILNVSNWTWSGVTINGPAAAMTRAGHTCQMGPNGQVIIVGGFINEGNNSYYVSPYMAVIDTKTWTWTTGYNGAPIDSIWNNNQPNINTESSSLSGGAKGGIGAGVVVVILGIALGFFLWRRRKLSSSRRNDRMIDLNLSQTISAKEMTQSPSNQYSGHSSLNLNCPDHGSHGLPVVPTAGASTSPSITASHIGHVTGPHHEMVHGNGVSNLQTTPGSLTASNMADPTINLENPAMVVTYPQQTNTSEKSGHVALPPIPSRPTNGTSNPVEYFKVDDKTSPIISISNSATSLSSNHSHISTESSIVVNAGHIPEVVPGITYMGSVLPSPSSPKLDAESTTIPNRLPTIHTPVVSTIMTGKQNTRMTYGPQSVPEHEAKIVRSAPGVKPQVATLRDLDPDGFYPPLTPTRRLNSNSILVGTPATNTPSAASSFSAITSSLALTPGGSDASGYFGPIAGVNREQNQRENNQPSHASPTLPYRDPRMMKDLADIAKLIESQTLAEVKNPQAILSPPSEVKKKSSPKD